MDKANRKVTFEEEADLYEKEALAEIKNNSSFFKILGSYPKKK